jgi:hypothetical protein
VRKSKNGQPGSLKVQGVDHPFSFLLGTTPEAAPLSSTGAGLFFSHMLDFLTVKPEVNLAKSFSHFTESFAVVAFGKTTFVFVRVASDHAYRQFTERKVGGLLYEAAVCAAKRFKFSKAVSMWIGHRKNF